MAFYSRAIAGDCRALTPVGVTRPRSGASAHSFLFARRGCRLILAVPMLSEDDFQYAIENTQVILEPAGQIATFGNTSFRFYLISELMDQVNEVRVRDGRIHAERPQILTPEHYCRLLLEGFGDKAQKYVEQFRERTRNAAVVRYGFQFRKTDVTEKDRSRFDRKGRGAHKIAGATGG